ncbi:MAG TPA: sugar ABC transporter permease [Deinococcales bacterium]|nr:sugar ABC transporter permease [Deinococcales bacterium]
MLKTANAPAREQLSFATRWNNFQRRYAPYIFISPWIILFLVFGLFPILFSLFISFTDWNPLMGLGNFSFVGFENYKFNLEDRLFWKSLINTFIIALESGIPQHLIAIPLAFAIHMGLKRFQSGITAVYFLPYITSTVAIALIFSTLFSRDFGVINAFINSLKGIPLIGGIFPEENINWLGSAAFVQPAISSVVVWRYVGWNTVLYLSGLQAIPRELYEAASVDGASTSQQFRFVTLPLLRPIMFLAVTLTIIGNLQLFEEPFVLVGPQGGFGQLGMTISMYMYRTAFEWTDFGTAAAMGWLLFLVIGALTLVNKLIFGRSGLARGD